MHAERTTAPVPISVSVASAWRSAILLAVLLALTSALLQRFWFGMNLVHAGWAAVAAACSGLTGWVAYHLISRRNENLLLLIILMIPIGSNVSPAWQMFVFKLGLSLFLGVMIGLIVRGLPTKGKVTQQGASPGPGPELDRR